MKCNHCWKQLEGRAVATTCGHLLCAEDANKILGSDGACPICDQVLSKSHIKTVDINPSDEWTNMAMVGLNPQILMKSMYQSIMFHVSQKELEMQCKMNRIIAQCRQKCETMQATFSEKLEHVHIAYQKMAQRCQMLEQEIENISKDKQELQEKFAEKSRQKRKLDEMYDQLRNEFDSVKHSSIRSSSNFYPRPEPDLFSDRTNMIHSRDQIRNERAVFTPETPGPRNDIWPTRQTSANSFDVRGVSPAKQGLVAAESGSKRFGVGAHPTFGAGASNSSMTLRNLILSPIRRPQLSRNRTNLFT